MAGSGALYRARRVTRLVSYARPYRADWVKIGAVTLIWSLMSVAQPWPMKVLVDHILYGRPPGEVVSRFIELLPFVASRSGLLGWVVAVGLLIFALNAVGDVLSTRLWIKVGQGMVNDLAADLFARVQRRSLLFHTQGTVGDLMARVTGDSWCVYKLIDTVVFTPLHAGMMLVGMAYLMFRMNPALTVAALAAAPVMAGATMLMGRRLRDAGVAQRAVETAIHAHVQQTLTGLPVVQAFAQEEREHARFRAFAADALRAVRRSAVVGSFAGLGPGLVTTLGTGLVLWIGSKQVLAGTLTVGGLLVFLTYLGTLQVQLAAWTTVYTGLKSAGASIDRVSEVLEAEPEIADRPGAVPLKVSGGHVQIRDVTAGYAAGRPVLAGVSLDLLPGETVAIVGPTGAGKSTLAGLLLRSLDPWAGQVLIDGHDVRDVTLRSLRRAVAVVLQEPFLSAGTIAENIAFSNPAAPRSAIEDAGRAAKVDACVRHLPAGYDSLVGEHGSGLSGGERQRIAIARALLKDAPILILDEPTSALDSATEEQILEALERLSVGRTTLVIAHRLSTIRRADKIAVLDRGRLVECGTHEELLARGGKYARLHAAQHGMADAAEDDELAEPAAEPAASASWRC